MNLTKGQIMMIHNMVNCELSNKNTVYSITELVNLKEQLTLTDVSQQRELLEDYQHFIDWNEEHDRKASTSERIESFIASNCG